jgi:hypothetical protein
MPKVESTRRSTYKSALQSEMMTTAEMLEDKKKSDMITSHLFNVVPTENLDMDTFAPAFVLCKFEILKLIESPGREKKKRLKMTEKQSRGGEAIESESEAGGKELPPFQNYRLIDFTG